MSIPLDWAGVGPVGLTWALTLRFQHAQHSALVRGFPAQARSSRLTARIRTRAWSLRSILIAAIVAALNPGSAR